MSRALQTSPGGHETRDVAIGPIVITGLGLVVLVALAGLIVYGVLRYLGSRPVATVRANPMAADDSQIPPPPRLEEHPAIEIQQLRVQEDHILSTYGWTDKKTGVVRISIDRAIELQLERGFPTRKEALKQ